MPGTRPIEYLLWKKEEKKFNGKLADYYFKSHAEENSSRIVGLYVKSKTIKLLEDSTADHVHNFKEGKDSSDMTQKARTIRGKSDKSESIKFKNVYSFEDVKTVEREATEQENLFSSILVTRTCGGLQSNKKEE